MSKSATPELVVDFAVLGSAKLPCSCDSPGKNPAVGCHALLEGDLLDSGIKPLSLTSLALADGFFTISALWEVHMGVYFLWKEDPRDISRKICEGGERWDFGSGEKGTVQSVTMTTTRTTLTKQQHLILTYQGSLSKCFLEHLSSRQCCHSGEGGRRCVLPLGRYLLVKEKTITAQCVCVCVVISIETNAMNKSRSKHKPRIRW